MSQEEELPKRIFRVHSPRQILTTEMSLEGDSTPRQPAAAGFPGLDRALSRKHPAFVWAQTLPSLQDLRLTLRSIEKELEEQEGNGREEEQEEPPPGSASRADQPCGASKPGRAPATPGREGVQELVGRALSWGQRLMHGAGRGSRASPKWAVGLS